MKRILSAIAILLFASISARAQSSTTFTITVVAPPSCTVAIKSNPVSTSGSKLYSGQAGTLNFDVSACASFSLATATATWDGASVVLSGSLSAAITAAQATVGSHALVLTIPAPVLAITSPVTLPNGQPGVTYSASLATLVKPTGGVPPYSYSLTSPLPAGLSLSSSGVVSGVASTPGSVTFSFNVTDSSLLSQLRMTKFIPA